jgi:hypothetical protein
MKIKPTSSYDAGHNPPDLSNKESKTPDRKEKALKIKINKSTYMKG